MIYISAFCFSETNAQELQKMIAIDDDESEELDDEFTEESLFNTLTSLSGASLAKNLLDFEKSKNSQAEPVLKLSEENQRTGLDMSNNGKVLEMYEDMAKRE
jgi:hypothetical protein